MLRVNGGRGGWERNLNKLCAGLIYHFTPRPLSQLVDNKFHAKKIDKVGTLSTALDSFDTSNAETSTVKDKHVIFHTKIINNLQNLQLTSKYCIVSLFP